MYTGCWLLPSSLALRNILLTSWTTSLSCWIRIASPVWKYLEWSLYNNQLIYLPSSLDMARTYLSYRYLLLTLLVTWVYAQNCENDYAGYAADFSEDSQDRWLYENIAPGAECVSISRTQTEGKGLLHDWWKLVLITIWIRCYIFWWYTLELFSSMAGFAGGWCRLPSFFPVVCLELYFMSCVVGKWLQLIVYELLHHSASKAFCCSLKVVETRCLFYCRRILKDWKELCIRV